ncbi:MAG: D-glycerate dehydrogenase, partial [Gemmatimonadaceae bacterium]|nr:D-glycerate dehydrogenase [Acetobacteraceae bacterium]
MALHRLVVARPVPQAVTDRARTEFDAELSDSADMPPDLVIQRLTEHRADALFFSSNLKLNADTIGRLPASVRVAATCSVGFDHIDVGAAQARGLVVTNTPEVLTDCTADLAFMLLLCACRRAWEHTEIMRAGWRRSFGMREMLGVQASNKTIGIVGFGRIGRAVAQRARGFNMTVLYTDVARAAPDQEHGAEYVASLHDMLPRCQIVSLHAPGGAATDKLMNAGTIGLLPRGALLVNAARGTLVDEDALIDALQSGQLFAAGLDVFRREPDFDQRLATLPNVFLTPHMGSATTETR